MSNDELRIHHDVVPSVFDVFTKCHIFGTHVLQYGPVRGGHQLQWVTEVWILERLQDVSSNRHESHAIIGHLFELWRTFDVFGAEKLEGPMFLEVVLVPLLHARKVLEVSHAVESRDHGVLFGVFDELKHLLGIEHDVAVDGDPEVEVQLPIEWFLVPATEDVET